MIAPIGDRLQIGIITRQQIKHLVEEEGTTTQLLLDLFHLLAASSLLLDEYLGACRIVAVGFNVRQASINAVDLVDNLATADVLGAEFAMTLNRIDSCLELTAGHKLHDAELESRVVFATSFLCL